ncbi:DUF2283 domain-containing protein [Thermithiobacillus plumbiphilus]|uniref:DUF2283 domain-containing protein n=1 Tax=Thermithiobacillus plumbiphilus TaxID=1729899 RepID=A0ABU9D4H7_9PROT
MKITYNATDDILVIEFSKDKIIKELSLSWNVNVGMTSTSRTPKKGRITP